MATWNLEHLAEKSGTGCNPRADADYAALADYARRLDADVVAFQEVESAAAATRVFDAAKYNIEISSQSLRAGYICERDGPSTNTSTRQLTGFAIKKTVRYQRNADFEAVDVSSNGSLRNAVDLTLTDNKLRLLAVHLKASCPGKPVSGGQKDCLTLFKQQSVLEEQWIEQRYRAGEAFAILGDFNRRLSLAGDDFLALTNDDDPKGLKLTPVVGSNERRCVEKYPDRIDHIVTDDRATSRIKANSLSVQVYDGGVLLSDHCAVSLVLN